MAITEGALEAGSVDQEEEDMAAEAAGMTVDSVEAEGVWAPVVDFHLVCLAE